MNTPETTAPETKSTMYYRVKDPAKTVGKGHTVNFGSNKHKRNRLAQSKLPKRYPVPVTSGPNKGTHVFLGP